MRLDLTYGIGGEDTSGPSRCLMLPLVMATSCEALRLEDFCRDKSKTGLIECCADAPGIGSVSWFVVLYCLLGYVAIPFLGLCSFLRGVHLEHCVHVRGWSKDVLVRQGRGMVQYLQRVRVLLSGLGLSESTRSLRECSPLRAGSWCWGYGRCICPLACAPGVYNSEQSRLAWNSCICGALYPPALPCWFWNGLHTADCVSACYTHTMSRAAL